MDISGITANIHTKTDAKNLVTSARTVHVSEQKETTHMVSMLRKEACSGSIHDLAHIPTHQTCLADCLAKASAQGENLIATVETRKLLDVDIHPHFGTLMEHKAFLSTWSRSLVHTKEKDVFFLNNLKIHLAQPSQEGPFQVVFVVTQPHKKGNLLNTRKSKGQDATKRTSAPAGSCIQFPWFMTSMSMTPLTGW